jgi:hypothetical protein
VNWAFYDVDGNRTLSQVAAFKAQEVHVDTEAPAPQELERLAKIEYHETLNAQTGVGPVMTFTRHRDMVAWFKAPAQQGLCQH